MKLLVFFAGLFALVGSTALTVADKPTSDNRCISVKGANLDFLLVNKTGYNIESIFVSPTTEKDWGEDIMGIELLEEGEGVDVSFDPGENASNWDIYVTWDGYDAEEDVLWLDLDLSTISEITLFYDAESGKSWAEVK